MDKEELRKYYLDQIITIGMDGVNLTDWEVEFITSLKRQLGQGRTLSDKQVSILDKIYTEKVK